MNDVISVRGASENNLRSVDLDVPVGAITVFTGVSGSGKSSLVFDTIAAESQRQLNETFPAFVRNRLPQLGKPEVDSLSGLSVAVLIEQRQFQGNARSTVGTATDLAPLLRLLYSRAGRPFTGYSNVFSFNQPAGMCPACQGLGTVDDLDEDALLDRRLSLDEGAIAFPTFAPGTAYWKRYVHSGLFDRTRPVRDWPAAEVDELLHAEPRTLKDPPPEWYRSSKYEGIVDRFRRTYLTGRTQSAERIRRQHADDFARVVTSRECPECHGGRLKKEVLASKIDGRNIADASRMPVEELVGFVRAVNDPGTAPLAMALADGLQRLVDVGLGYLDLDRVSSTLSGGEAQRVKLVRHLGSSLTRLAYILDEPSVGLHPADVARLNGLLVDLRDAGNTVLVVEHDPDVIAIADHAVDMRPDSGSGGGTVCFDGDLAGLEASDTATGAYLRALRTLRRARSATGTLARVRRATLHNLQSVSVDIPAGIMTAITGVAGSGKSSLVDAILAAQPGLTYLDQTPLRGGRRSTPLTYLDVFDDLRRAFARASDLDESWFSANSAGACPVCRGLGVIVTELAFMDDVELPCDACDGRRYNERTLAVRIDGRSIADVLATRASDAVQSLDADALPGLVDAASRMVRAGIGYVALGQSLDTLSGGERQRLRLAHALAEPSTAYVLDEPTTGLHGRDVARLIALLDELVDGGASILVIEHNLDVIAAADHIVDVGPGAGRHGGRIVFEGSPHDLVRRRTGATAEHLRRWIDA